MLPASVSLLLDAEAAEAQGDQAQADALWRQLLLRFPDEPSSARARQRFPERHRELLKRQPAHPAALATAAALDPDLSGGHQGALHLARWGWRWPGAGARIRQACATGEPSAPGATAAGLGAEHAGGGDRGGGLPGRRGSNR